MTTWIWASMTRVCELPWQCLINSRRRKHAVMSITLGRQPRKSYSRAAVEIFSFASRTLTPHQ